ncbi:14841_t:CDS:2, partial [Racocetra persica]
HIISKCPKVEELDKKYVALTKTLTNKQTIEFQQLINVVFENNYINDDQLPQALELVLEILEDLIDREKLMKNIVSNLEDLLILPQNKKEFIFKNFNSYYILDESVKRSSKNIELDFEKGKINLEPFL